MPNARCPWPSNPLAIAYHDAEWGVPLFDDRALFELLTLEGAQAGLSWNTILTKRDRYREVYRGFDAERIARFTPRDVERLLGDPGIVRNRLKVEASISNARAFLDIMSRGTDRAAAAPGRRGRTQPGPFAAHLWSFVGHAPLNPRRESMKDVPASTPESDAMSKDLKKRGFRFVGSTICYAFMQAAGMVNDHLVTCPRHAACARLAGAAPPPRPPRG